MFLFFCFLFCFVFCFVFVLLLFFVLFVCFFKQEKSLFSTQNNERTEKAQTQSTADLTTAINVIIALSFVPAGFLVFLVTERANKSKHLQFVTGCNPAVYWLANFVFDYINYLIPAGVCIGIFYAFNVEAYSGHNFPAVCTMLLLYGWAITPAIYPFSHLFEVPATAYVTLICINLFLGLCCTLATFSEFFEEIFAIVLLCVVVVMVCSFICLFNCFSKPDYYLFIQSSTCSRTSRKSTTSTKSLAGCS